MLTGVETAGLILAALPLIISALEYYKEGLRPLKDFLSYKIVVRNLICDLSTQRILFRNTLERLLTGLVDGDIELALLLEHPGGPEWRNAKLESDLQQRLRGAFPVYEESVHDMQSILETFKEQLELNSLDSHGRPTWLDAKSYKKARKKIVMCLSRKEHEALLQRMDKDNRNLRTLTLDSLDLEPTRVTRRHATEPFRKIRDHAKSLHNVLRLGWSCTCTSPHRASLQLERRDSQSQPAFRVVFPYINSVLPVMSGLSIWQETEIRPLDEDPSPIKWPQRSGVDLRVEAGAASLTATKSKMAIVKPTSQLSAIGVPVLDKQSLPFAWHESTGVPKKKVGWAAISTAKADQHNATTDRLTESISKPSIDTPILAMDARRTRIADLCDALDQIRSKENCRTCLGCLADDDDRLLGVYTIRQHFLRHGEDSTTLHDVLNMVSLESSPASTVIPLGDQKPMSPMTRKQRLQLAVTLASTALQLQSTPWLASQWGKKDIVFHNGLADQPYVSRIFSNVTLEPQQPIERTSWSPIRNESVFNLGVLLLELSFGKSLNQLRIPEDPEICTEYAIAKRLVETMADEEASGYTDAAKACIFCDFGTKIKTHDFNNDAFRQAVYDDVVIPLEEEWKHFNRRST